MRRRSNPFLVQLDAATLWLDGRTSASRRSSPRPSLGPELVLQEQPARKLGGAPLSLASCHPVTFYAEAVPAAGSSRGQRDLQARKGTAVKPRKNPGPDASPAAEYSPDNPQQQRQLMQSHVGLNTGLVAGEEASKPLSVVLLDRMTTEPPKPRSKAAPDALPGKAARKAATSSQPKLGKSMRLLSVAQGAPPAILLSSPSFKVPAGASRPGSPMIKVRAVAFSEPGGTTTPRISRCGQGASAQSAQSSAVHKAARDRTCKQSQPNGDSGDRRSSTGRGPGSFSPLTRQQQLRGQRIIGTPGTPVPVIFTGVDIADAAQAHLLGFSDPLNPARPASAPSLLVGSRMLEGRPANGTLQPQSQTDTQGIGAALRQQGLMPGTRRGKPGPHYARPLERTPQANCRHLTAARPAASTYLSGGTSALLGHHQRAPRIRLPPNIIALLRDTHDREDRASSKRFRERHVTSQPDGLREMVRAEAVHTPAPEAPGNYQIEPPVQQQAAAATDCLQQAGSGMEGQEGGAGAGNAQGRPGLRNLQSKHYFEDYMAFMAAGSQATGGQS